MNRLFEENKNRNIVSLDGVWQFKTDENNAGLAQGWALSPPADCHDMPVPSLWTCMPGFYRYEGVAWYFRRFTASGFTALVFHGVTGLADVYVDGVHAGQHYGGWTGFEVLLKNLTSSEHFLALRVNSTSNHTDTIPLTVADWFHHGGIMRGTELHLHDTARITHFAIRYTLSHLKDGKADATVVCSLRFFSNTTQSIQRTVKMLVDGKVVAETAVSIAGKGEAKITFELKQINLWSPDSPALYRFDAEIEDDGVADMTGFRLLEARDGKILLNGKAVKLKGVNRHEEHPDFGHALPLSLHYKDMAIIKEAGCNTIRGSHYPNDQRFLDLCDREGMLFWEEVPMWQFHEAQHKNQLVLERACTMHTQMVERDINHPSIIMWGLHNENDMTTQAAFSFSKSLAETIRTLDSSRLLTYATMMPLEDICFSLVDVVSVNKYFGWYVGESADWKIFLRDFYKKLDDEGFGDKPVIISEFGAGAIPGVRNFDAPKWSEDFQADYLDYTLKLFLADPRIAGTYIWQYCDIRVGWDSLGRPRGFNNKGIVDEYRRPKLAYKMVKSCYTDISNE
ncbi:beta-glucuronidase [Spirochaetia bacterium]|nr:beta-glucuronidase [Spirochaetia bacterium]GHU31479.1 beta-glucuronidase [Spirochaetia bacterium]